MVLTLKMGKTKGSPGYFRETITANVARSDRSAVYWFVNDLGCYFEIDDDFLIKYDVAISLYTPYEKSLVQIWLVENDSRVGFQLFRSVS